MSRAPPLRQPAPPRGLHPTRPAREGRTNRIMPLHTVTYRYIPLYTVTGREGAQAATCRYIPLNSVTYRYRRERGAPTAVPLAGELHRPRRGHHARVSRAAGRAAHGGRRGSRRSVCQRALVHGAPRRRLRWAHFHRSERCASPLPRPKMSAQGTSLEPFRTFPSLPSSRSRRSPPGPWSPRGVAAAMSHHVAAGQVILATCLNM